MTQPISDGHIYVNDGETFDNGIYAPEVPIEQQEQEQEEKAVTAASYPVMASVAEWFKREIANCPNIHNIQTEAITIGETTYDRKVSIEAQVLAYQLLKEHLQAKFDEFKEFVPEEES